MNEARKTATMAGVAGVLAVLALATAPRSVTPDAFQDRGTSFFPGFTDARMAQSLEVVDFDEETATAHPFKIQATNGLWTIPSEYDYPVDGTERLAKTIASIIALKKDSVASQNVSDEENTGTLDPLDESLPTFQGRGERVTIKGDNDRILADVIIGKPLAGRPEYRYVRLASQARVYVAQAGDLDISSKFMDWIDRNLLHIEWNELDQAIIRDYSLNKVTHGVDVHETLFLRKLGIDEDNVVHWTMNGLQPKELVDTFRANLLNTTLNELSIVGVRPKPPAIAAGLTQTGGTLKVSPADLSDMASKGFHFTEKGDLLSEGGEVLAHTRTGIVYRLSFGAVAYGDADERAPDPPESKAPQPPTGARATPGQDKTAARDQAKAAPQAAKPVAAPLPNRYLIITASFDPTAAAEKPALEGARQKAGELQRRYAPWYYVIPGVSVERMMLPRSVLVRTIADKPQKPPS